MNEEDAGEESVMEHVPIGVIVNETSEDPDGGEMVEVGAAEVTEKEEELRTAVDDEVVQED